MSSGLSQKPAEAVEHGCGQAFVGRERPAVNFDFVNRLQRHAKIQIVKRAVAFDAPQPAGQVGDFLDFILLAGIKQDPPFVAAQKTVGLAPALKPRIAQQDADGLARTLAEPVKNQRRVGFAKMLERDVERVVGRRREPGLKTEMESALLGVRFFDAKIFRKNPDEVRGETALGEQLFPGVERLLPMKGV